MTSNSDFLAAVGSVMDDSTTATGGVFTPTGERMWIEKEPAPGIQMRTQVFDEDGNVEVVSTLYAPAPSTPAGYPSELPFVPESAVSVVEMPGSEKPPTAQWWGVADTRIVVDRIRRESLDQGWTVAEDEQGSEVAAPEGLPVSTAVFSFTRGGSERTVIASQIGAQGVVQLFDGCPDPAPDFRVISPNTTPQAT